MPFGYSNKIFSHPAVEYIPIIPLRHLDFDNQINTQIKTMKPELTLFLDSNKLQNFLNNSEFIINPKEELGLYLENAHLDIIRYRGLYVSILIKFVPNKVQIAKILTRYFYKPKLLFQLIDSEGTIHCQKLWEVPNIR